MIKNIIEEQITTQQLTSIFSLVDLDGAVGGWSLKNITVSVKGITHRMNSTNIRFAMPCTV